MIKYCTSFLFALLLASSATYSQKAGVELLASPRKDSILLRWAPVDQKTWKVGNRYGYTIVRYTVLRDKKVPKEIAAVQLTKEPLKPRPLAEWEPLSDNKYVAIAGECIYSDPYSGISTGGNPFIAVKKHKNDMHRFSFALYAADQSIVAAKLSGLYFADKSAQPNEKYLYKVFIPAPDSVLRIDTASAFTGISEYQPLPKPFELKAEWDDKKVSLSWNFKYLKHIYNSYLVEKSEDGGKTYSALGDNGVVQLADAGVSPEFIYRSDSLTSNDISYCYRVKGVSAFGEVGPPSDSVSGKGVKPIEAAPVITENMAIDNKVIKLSWAYPDDMNRYISGFRIYSSSKPKGRKKKIYESKSPSERSFIDTLPDITNYYLISVFNSAKEKFSSITTYSELVDSVPPLPPQGVAGIIDSTGKVMMRWNRNSDKDLEGYRVYSSNNPRFEFILETPAVLKDTTFVDTINIKTLTREIYYKVRAIDVRQNQSEFSEMLTITRPDVIPPVSPVIKSIEEQKGSISMTWVNSSSSDVVFHRIYRKEKRDSLFRELVKLERVPDVRSTYVDKSVNPGKEYIYFVKAEDNSGLFSPPSKAVACKTTGSKESITLKKREQTDRVKLVWEIKSEKEVVKVVVYRSVDELPMQLYDNSLEDSYTDMKLSPEKTYKYRIKAIYNDGSSSELSNTVKVKM
jgi:fibronectin type 3 domain-containing protein